MTLRILLLRSVSAILRVAGLLFYGATGYGLGVAGLIVADIIESRRFDYSRQDLFGSSVFMLAFIGLPIIIGRICRGVAFEVQRRISTPA